MKSLSLFLIVLYSFLSTSIVAAQTPTKEEEITGRVVAYTTNGEIQLVSSAAYFQTIILRIETKENDLAVKRYVKLDYEFIGNGTLLPKKMLKGKHLWTFRVTGAKHLDMKIEDMAVKFFDEDTGQLISSTSKLIWVSESEKKNLEDITLSAYIFSRGKCKRAM